MKLSIFMVKCKHCGRNIPYDANLCPYCGRSIKQFHQKDIPEEETQDEQQPVKQEQEMDYQMPKAKSDKKLLFFILTVLVLLLIAGLIYRSSLNNDDEDETTETVKKEYKTPDTDNQNQSEITFNPEKKQFVVVNGDGVRFRFGPSMKHKFLTDDKGAQISVKKGTRLQCVGEKDNWYQVIYNGKKYYMSKDYTYLVE